jgi:hypothetical protein
MPKIMATEADTDTRPGSLIALRRAGVDDGGTEKATSRK